MDQTMDSKVEIPNHERSRRGKLLTTESNYHNPTIFMCQDTIYVVAWHYQDGTIDMHVFNIDDWSNSWQCLDIAQTDFNLDDLIKSSLQNGNTCGIVDGHLIIKLTDDKIFRRQATQMNKCDALEVALSFLFRKHLTDVKKKAQKYMVAALESFLSSFASND